MMTPEQYLRKEELKLKVKEVELEVAKLQHKPMYEFYFGVALIFIFMMTWLNFAYSEGM